MSLLLTLLFCCSKTLQELPPSSFLIFVATITWEGWGEGGGKGETCFLYPKVGVLRDEYTSISPVWLDTSWVPDMDLGPVYFFGRLSFLPFFLSGVSFNSCWYLSTLCRWLWLNLTNTGFGGKLVKFLLSQSLFQLNGKFTFCSLLLKY